MVSFKEQNETICMNNTFAYVQWKLLHEQHNWLGTSAVVHVCANTSEFPSECCYVPVQKISCRCAYIIMLVQFANYTERVFIATPVPIKYSL